MKENLIIYTCREGSTSAKELAALLDCRCIQRSDTNNVREVPRGALVVTYGMGWSPQWAIGKNVRYLNEPEAVGRKISKIWQINQFMNNDVPTLEITRSIDNARMWLRRGRRVLARGDVGMDGSGILILNPGDEVPRADFYAQEFLNDFEYRVHAFNGKAIDIIQRKRTYRAPTPTNATQAMIRSWDNGWVFTHNFRISQAERQTLSDIAVAAVDAVGLDFGAVDILHKHGVPVETQYAVCEVNSAPGIVYDESFEAYKNAILEVYNG